MLSNLGCQQGNMDALIPHAVESEMHEFIEALRKERDEALQKYLEEVREEEQKVQRNCNFFFIS